MDANLLITESVLNDGMSALVGEVTADEAFAVMRDGRHEAAARLGTRVLVGYPDRLESHDHEGTEEAMICFAGILASAINGDVPLVITTGDEASLRARAASADADFHALITARLAAGTIDPAHAARLLIGSGGLAAVLGSLGIGIAEG